MIQNPLVEQTYKKFLEYMALCGFPDVSEFKTIANNKLEQFQAMNHIQLKNKYIQYDEFIQKAIMNKLEQ